MEAPSAEMKGSGQGRRTSFESTGDEGELLGTRWADWQDRPDLVAGPQTLPVPPLFEMSDVATSGSLTPALL